MTVSIISFLTINFVVISLIIKYFHCIIRLSDLNKNVNDLVNDINKTALGIKTKLKGIHINY